MLGVLLAALASDATGQRWPVRNYTERDGLPGTPVYDCAQDDRGVMWFMTRVGPVRYDGHSWQLVALPRRLTSGTRFLAIAGGQTPWVATDHLPLIVWERSTDWVDPRPHWNDGSHQGYPRGFAVLGRDARQIPVALTKNALLWMDEDGWHDLPLNLGARDQARQLLIRGDQILVLSDSRISSYRLAATGLERRQPLLPEAPGRLLGMCPADGEALWLVGNTWIGRLDSDGARVLATETHTFDLRWRPTVTCVGDAQGGLYFGKQHQLFHYNPRLGQRRVKRESGVQCGHINKLFRDREDQVWFCGAYGISRIVSRALARMLQTKGMTVTTCAEGAEAIEEFRREFEADTPYDLTFLDLTVPDGLGGQQTAEQILVIDPGARIIAMSGYSAELVPTNHESYGFAAFLAKPFTFEELLVCVDQALQVSME